MRKYMAASQSHVREQELEEGKINDLAAPYIVVHN